MTAPNVYNYDPNTGVYLSTSVAKVSPLECDDESGDGAVYLVPAYTTKVAPPTAEHGKAAVFKNGVWSMVDDHRGEVHQW